MKFPFIINSEGKQDAMLTFSALAMFVICINLSLATISGLTMQEFSISFVPMGDTTILALLGSTLGAYTARKATDRHFNFKKLSIRGKDNAKEDDNGEA